MRLKCIRVTSCDQISFYLWETVTVTKQHKHTVLHGDITSDALERLSVLDSGQLDCSEVTESALEFRQH